LHGWLNFHPKSPAEIPKYESRVSDALEWIALHTLSTAGIFEEILDCMSLSPEERERLLLLQIEKGE